MVASANTLESSKLAQCEEVIERGLDSFIEVGNALLVIREERLYRSDYDDFETYCEERWEISGRRARQLIGAVRTIANLESGTIVPKTESQVRPLVSLPPVKQKEAWESAIKSSKNGKPTAKQVAESVLQIKGGKPVTVAINGRVTNSVTLQALKRLWKEASAADQEAFRKWIA
jgi:hypothetical protein